MNNFRKLIAPCRFVISLEKRLIFTAARKEICTSYSGGPYLSNSIANTTRNMSQKSITSFFKITPKKTEETKRENHLQEESPTKLREQNCSNETSPASNEEEKRKSKRPRLESSDSELGSPKPNKRKSSPHSSETKKKSKRQRIESSSSEGEQEMLLVKNSKPNTYASPKSRKHTSNAIKTPLAVVNGREPRLDPEVIKDEVQENSEKEECKDVEKEAKMETELKTVKKSPSPVSKKLTVKKEKKTPKEKKVKTENSAKKEVLEDKKNVKLEKTSKEESKKDKDSPEKKKPVKNVMSFFVRKDAVNTKIEGDDKGTGKVSEEEYNPAKSKYHPVEDACWSQGQEVPYLALARTLETIEATSARLKIIEILANYFRSVIALTPEDLLPSVYLCLNQLAPAYHSLELGIAETYLMKAIGQCTGRSLAQVKAAVQREGDLGTVAQSARATQRTMLAPAPLKLRRVFEGLKEIAHMTGQASVNKKINKIQSLFIACRHSEAKYLIRSLEGKLRIGLAEQSVLQALAVATVLTPPRMAQGEGEEGAIVLDASKGLSPEQLKAKIDQQSLLIKSTYCECPNYELVIPALLEHGAAALPSHCKLTPGIPIKPMLAHPTKGIHEVFNRFENEQFTCEWKYDGERAQIHVPSTEDGKADFANAKIFSRNQEDNTSKYPDVLRRLPALLKDSVSSCVLDTEAVAYDVDNKQILPFQILSTRKRKDANEAEIKVQVCVFAFDLLFLNGRPLVREELAERRDLLKAHFNGVEGEWQFAEGADCSTLEEVQALLEQSVKGSCEGLMVKTLRGAHARYDIARRSHNWLKLKKDYLDGVGDTIDVVVIGGYRGRGKRAGCFGGFLLAAYDADCDEYQSLCKIGTGFSDEDLQTLSKALEEHVIDAPKSYYRFDQSHAPDAWFSAALVWEIRCADLSLSPAHRAAIGLVDPDKGISLRFPRFIRVREDKTPEQATSARQIADMYLAQDQVKNQTAKPGLQDDFY